MSRHPRFVIPSIIVLIVLVLSLAFTTAAYADDGTLPPVTEEVADPANGGDADPATGGDADPATGGEADSGTGEGESQPPATEEETEPPVVNEETQPPVEEGETQPPAEELTVAEVLEAAPEGTEVVVLDETGEVLPLASLEAAEIIQTGDPYFTVGLTTYYFFPTGSVMCDFLLNCTASDTPIQTAINYLNGTGPGSPWAGTGATPIDYTIYVEAGTYTENVTINGNGGWNSGINKPSSLNIRGSGSSQTILDGWFSIQNMNVFTLYGFSIVDANSSGNATYLAASNNTGTLTLEGLDVTNQTGTGIVVDFHDGDITATDVTANGNRAAGAYLDTSAGSGDIDVSYSTFGDNGYHGLEAYSRGKITLAGVTANGNGMVGAYLENSNGSGNIDVSDSTFGYIDDNGTPDNTADDISHGNDRSGLIANSAGDITLAGVIANDNWEAGANLSSSGDIFVNPTSTFNGNGGHGLAAYSAGDITLAGMTANDNGYDGAYLDNCQWNGEECSRTGSITISDSFFGEIGNGNRGYGLEAYSNGDITLHTVTANDNAGNGAYLDNCQWNGVDCSGTGSIIISDSIFGEIEGGNGGAGLAIKSNGSITLSQVIANDNGSMLGGSHGLEAYSNGDITLDNVTASGNSWDGAYLNNGWWDELEYSGTGSITVSDSIFGEEIESGNGGGLEAYSNGDITLHNVTASGNSWGGAYLANDSGGASGSITVDLNSVFNDNGDEIDRGSGLIASSNGNIEISNITANGNMSSGAYLVTGENATIVCSEFKTNGDYGVVGADTLTDVTFGVNGSGDYAGAPNMMSGVCAVVVDTKDDNSTGGNSTADKPAGEILPLHIVPVGGGEKVDLDCVSYRGTRLILPSGDSVILPCPTRDDGHLTGMTLSDLPGQLTGGNTFVSAMEAKVLRSGEPLGTTSSVVVDFFVPLDQQGKDLTILCWNGSEWVDLGGSYSGDHFVVETNYIGFYVLAAK